MNVWAISPNLFFFFFLLLLFTSIQATKFEIQNNCNYTIWAAANPGGGRKLGIGETWVLEIDDNIRNLSGRIWGRTNCSFNENDRGKCETGDCDGILQCQTFGSPPKTQAEYILNGLNNLDSYGISLVDGYNIPMVFKPNDGNCKPIVCAGSVTFRCPEVLRAPGGCYDPCTVFKTDEYCCNSSNCGPTNYSRLFKNWCPAAYSYPKDEGTSTFTCPSTTNYVVQLCAALSESNARQLQAYSETVNATSKQYLNGTLSKLPQPAPAPEPSQPQDAIPVVVVILLFIIILGCCILGCCIKRRRKKKLKKNKNMEEVLKNLASLGPRRYNYSDIKKMTNSFKDKIGQGGFGGVFKGKLQDGLFVAVKVLTESKGNGEDFINEVMSIGRTAHVNIVNLLGFCLDGANRALIYEFMPNGSLEKFIYNERNLQGQPRLGWERLHHIALGIARGLEYLHYGCNTRILHFDIKPHNILLDEDLCPKISDFGLAMLCHKKESIISMAGTRGTIGYIAPEVIYRSFGGVSHKSDVYSYGMMILEMVGGRKNLDIDANTSQIYFPHWIYTRLEQKMNLGLQITNEEEEIARKMILVGLWCIQTHPSNRPSINKVLEMLEGDIKSLKIPPKPFFSSPPRSTVGSSTTSIS